MRVRLPLRLALATAALVGLASCGGGSGSPTPNGPGGGATTTSAAAAPTTSHPSSPAPAAARHVVARLAGITLSTPVSRAVVLTQGRDHVLILGGLHTGDVSTDAVVQVDLATGRSVEAGRLALAVHDAAGAFIGDRVVVFGGGAASTVATVQSWTTTGATEIGTLPDARSDLVAAAVGDTVYVLGGFDGSQLVQNVVATRDGKTFTIDGQLAQPVRYAAIAVLGGDIWIIGGQLSTTEGSITGPQTADIQRYDPATGATAVVGHLPSPLGYAAAFVLDGSLFVAGGSTAGTPSTAIWRIDPATGAVARAGALPGPRSDAGVAVLGSTAWLVGGESTGPEAPLATVVELQPTP